MEVGDMSQTARQPTRKEKERLQSELDHLVRSTGNHNGRIHLPHSKSTPDSPKPRCNYRQDGEKGTTTWRAPPSDAFPPAWMDLCQDCWEEYCDFGGEPDGT